MLFVRINNELTLISSCFRRAKTGNAKILPFTVDFRRMMREAIIEQQLAHLGFLASNGAGKARYEAGSRHFTICRLTLNQRVQGSSPWGLTITKLEFKP